MYRKGNPRKKAYLTKQRGVVTLQHDDFVVHLVVPHGEHVDGSSKPHLLFLMRSHPLLKCLLFLAYHVRPRRIQASIGHSNVNRRADLVPNKVVEPALQPIEVFFDEGQLVKCV